MKVTLVERYTEEEVMANPNTIYVYGDNLLKRGKAGQAVIRDCPNAFGIPTKRLPATTKVSYFSDTQDEKMVLIETLRILDININGKDMVLPLHGIGTGLAKMPEKSPELFKFLTESLRMYNKDYLKDS